MNEPKSIHIKGARVHNLRNIEVEIPHDTLTVITGLSGSGKSTLAFDTIFAEGQRRYVESLSAYARQFLGKIDKPDVDLITGIAPAIAIEQKVNTRNPRSTVGTTTEIYDYLKLLFARIGRTFSPVSGREVKCYDVDDVAQYVLALGQGAKALVAAPLVAAEGQGVIEKLTLLMGDGIQRVQYDGRTRFIEELLPELDPAVRPDELSVIVDRLRVASDEEFATRLRDSVARAFAYGDGVCRILTDERAEEFSSRFEADGIAFEQPTEHLFSFNNPLGACPRCEGYGKIIGIDEDLVIPDKSKTIYEGAIACWRGETMRLWKEKLVENAGKFDFPIHTPYHELTPEQKRLLWTGNEYFYGLDSFFEYIDSERRKIQFRVMKARYTGKTRCPECGGSRLRKEALYVRVGDRTIADLVTMNVDALLVFFKELQLDAHDPTTARRILTEIVNRLQYLADVGLGYLTLDRLSSTLSGGESQRINLATSLGSNLVGSLYILDEPSIGLHPRDTNRLVGVLKQLRDIGNTVIVVEHEEEVIRAADWIGLQRRRDRFLRPREKTFRLPEKPHGRLPGRTAADRTALDAARVEPFDRRQRGAGEQPAKHRRALSAGSHDLRHGRQRLGQVVARQGNPLPGTAAHALRHGNQTGRLRRAGRRRTTAQIGRNGRPEPDRKVDALESRHLHQSLR